MLLQADNLHFAYGGRQTGRHARARSSDGSGPVIDGVSVSIPAGGIVGLLGPNGSGKTTLLKLLAGALQPQIGTVTLSGQSLQTIPRRELARRLAVVPQETHLAFDYSVLEMALMGRYPWLSAFEVEGPDDLAAAHEALVTTGTDRFSTRAFPTLSGGEKQRVVIASALAQLDDRGPTGQPAPQRLLFLDEPTASLDLHYQLEIGHLIERLHSERGVTIVLSSHDLRLVSSVCTSAILLSNGRVLAHGPTREVMTPTLVSELYDIHPAQAAPLLA